MNRRTKVRWGVVGAGGIARRRTIPEGIIPAANAELVAVCAPHSADAVAAEHGGVACATLDQLLAQPCDAIYVATPVDLHLEQIRRCARAGKHVLCEKPLTRNGAEAEQGIQACRDADVKLGVGLMMRFHAQHVAARQLVREGAIGQPVYGRAQLSCWYPPIENAWRQDPRRSGGGSLTDLGSHLIDLLEMFLGRVTRVSCTLGNRSHGYGVEDTALATLEFAGGARGVVEAMFNVPDAAARNRLELYGSGGSILAEETISQADRGRMLLYREVNGGASYDASQTREARRASRGESAAGEPLPGAGGGVFPGDPGRCTATDRG